MFLGYKTGKKLGEIHILKRWGRYLWRQESTIAVTTENTFSSAASAVSWPQGPPDELILPHGIHETLQFMMSAFSSIGWFQVPSLSPKAQCTGLQWRSSASYPAIPFWEENSLATLACDGSVSLDWLRTGESVRDCCEGEGNAWVYFAVFHESFCFSQSSFFYYYSFIHMCIHCLGHFSLLPLPPPSSPPPSRQNLFCAFLQFRWRVEISNNKKDIAFLLAEIRTAIQRDS
jgi:hypothetical protein